MTTESQQIRKNVDKLIMRRHHGIRHILNTLTTVDGAFWMNSVKINKRDVH